MSNRHNIINNKINNNKINSNKKTNIYDNNNNKCIDLIQHVLADVENNLLSVIYYESVYLQNNTSFI